MGTMAINTLYVGKKLWICISPADINTLIDNQCLALNDICAVDNMFPRHLIAAVKRYKGDQQICIWYGIQQAKQTPLDKNKGKSLVSAKKQHMETISTESNVTHSSRNIQLQISMSDSKSGVVLVQKVNLIRRRASLVQRVK